MIIALSLIAALLGVASPAAGLTLESAAFRDQEPIPRVYTCQGLDVSPALAWSDVPPGTRSFALIVEDPDVPDPTAPTRTWVHWVLYDIPAQARSLPRDVASAELPGGTRQGTNDWKQAGYGGPCPPIGRHRYFWKLYALSETLPNLDLPDARKLEAAMKGRVLAQATLMGTFEKTK